MPELKWHWGYPVVVSFMVFVCLFLYRNFRNNNWL
jgi:magnesium transporter